MKNNLGNSSKNHPHKKPAGLKLAMVADDDGWILCRKAVSKEVHKRKNESASIDETLPVQLEI
ncbi:hypothetical protein D3C87_2119640 [compost metagenome]